MDNLTKAQRHKNMKHIKSSNTKIEVLLRQELWRRGYRYRKNYKGLPGKPDIVLTKYKIAIFCDSEFFHGKDWEVLKRGWRRGITVNTGSIKLLETASGMKRLIRNCCLWAGQ